MKKTKIKKVLSMILSAVLLILLIIPAAKIPAGAASEGTKDMNEAAGGKNILMYPLFIEGGDGAVPAEGPEQMFEYDKSSKYCGGTTFYAIWKYEKAYIAERLLLRTANDNKQFPRRMGDGWTLSGSNNGSDWTVLYTGVTDDTLNENMTYFYIDLPDNKTEYSYYKLEADDYAEGEESIIQLCAAIICVNESVEVPAERPYITKNYTVTAFGSTVIEAPDFDSGKYNETNAGEGQHDCRPDEEVQTQYCGSDYIGRVDEDGNPIDGTAIGNIGWTAAGEWVQYTVEVKRDGVYKFDAWVASGDDPPGSVDIYIDGDDNFVGSASAIKDKWQTYAKETAGSGEMTAGTHVIKVVFPTGGVNFQAIEITRTGDIVVPADETAEPEDSGDSENAGGDSEPIAAVDEGDGSGDANFNLIIYILIGAILLVVIVIIIVFATKKKK